VGAPLRGSYQDQARNHPARGHSVVAAPTLHDEPGGPQFAQMMDREEPPICVVAPFRAGPGGAPPIGRSVRPRS